MDRGQIQQAITAIEAQRAALGNAVVTTTVNALKELLDGSQMPVVEAPRMPAARRKQLTILFARVTGFSGVASGLEDTAVNIINALWQHLDGAILHQGGTIDKHMGDAVMGIFGVPQAHEDDPEQAIRAALQMRAALSDFVSELGTSWEADHTESIDELKNLRVSVGINTGPVLLGQVGESDEYTVIGDAVNVASRLEQSAPPGGILISHDTYILVRDTFDVEPLGPVPIRGRSEPVQVYLVLGVKPRLFYASGRGVEGVETSMVGRDTELAGLKAAMQLAISQGVGRAITVEGDAGVGKSRLVHEFSLWLKTMAEEVEVLKGRTYQHLRHIPYSLIRDLLATYLGIQDNDPASVAEEKLMAGMMNYVPGDEDERRNRVLTLAQLIGIDLGQVLLPEAANDEAGEGLQLKDLAYQYMVDFLVGITAVFPAVLIFLEDLHWADEGSLELLEYLLTSCRQKPIMIVMLTRPVEESLDKDQALARYQELLGRNGKSQLIQLRSLTESQSRELVVQILRKVPEIPPDLSDLIVSRSEGNPLYVEEMVKILIEDGVIIAGQEEWQVRRNQLQGVRVPPHVNGVIQARLDRLSEIERVTVQRAAAVGRVFWDSAVIHMNETAVNPMSPQETRSALQALEKREMVFPRQISGFSGSQAYVFKHAVLHQVAYESILLRQRPAYHKQVGDWLADQSGERIGEYAGLIAEHYEMAGERTAAAELYETAARRAKNSYDPQLAIDYYRKALFLLLEQSHYAEWLLRLQEQLGILLQMQGRFVEASQAFMTMRYTAEEDGDLGAQGRAWNGLAEIQLEQGQYPAVLASAKEAEQVAWLVGAELELIRSLLLQGEAHLQLGTIEDALDVVERALQLSDRQEEIIARTRSLHLLVLTQISHGRYKAAEQGIYQLQQQLSLLLTLDELHAAAVTQFALGSLQTRLGQYDEATASLLATLKIQRTLDEQTEVGRTLYQLGESARLRGNLNSAIPFYRKSISVANGIGFRYFALNAQAGLAGTLIGLHNYLLADDILQETVSTVENEGLMAGWRYLPELYVYLAAVYLGQKDMNSALQMARKAHELAQRQRHEEIIGVTWRMLGRVISKMPPARQQVQMGQAIFSAADCFAQSMQVFEKVNGGGVASYRDQAYTLWQWADHETGNGNADLGSRLKDRANKLAEQLGLALID